MALNNTPSEVQASNEGRNPAPSSPVYVRSLINSLPVEVKILTWIAVVIHLIGFISIGMFQLSAFYRMGIIHVSILFLLFITAFRACYRNLLVASCFIFSISYLAEWIGVHYGLVFGNYHYNGSLGVKLFEVPILISIFWIAVSCGAVSLARRLSSNFWVINILAALFGVLFDLVIEPVAMHLQYWEWKEAQVPVTNYISWGLMIFLFAAVIQWLNIRDRGFAANFYLLQLTYFNLLQFCFFPF